MAFERIRAYVLIFLASTLCSTVVLKIGDIQYLELIFAADFLVLIVLSVRSGLRWEIFRPFWEIGQSYTIFLALAFVLSLFGLGQDFPGALHSSILKKPVLVTIARMVELSLDVFYSLYLASLFRENNRLCRFGAKTYCWTAVAGCLYSFATLPANLLFETDLGTYTSLHRFRGFDNEGSGFGMYLLTAGVLAVALQRLGWITRRQFIWWTVIFCAGFVGARSKSGFAALGIFGVLYLLYAYRGWRRWALIGSMAAVLLIATSLLNFNGAINAYIQGTEQYQKMSNLRAGDANIVMGRISGAVLGPRMIAAHPLTGIGWGNYPLVRDNPEYRRGTAFELDTTDAPNLGAVDYIVDLGFPLWIYLMWIELKPVVMLRKRGADRWVVTLAFMLPLSTWVGVHLNLIHPWIALAFALGLGYEVGNNRMHREGIAA